MPEETSQSGAEIQALQDQSLPSLGDFFLSALTKHTVAKANDEWGSDHCPEYKDQRTVHLRLLGWLCCLPTSSC